MTTSAPHPAPRTGGTDAVPAAAVQAPLPRRRSVLGAGALLAGAGVLGGVLSSCTDRAAQDAGRTGAGSDQGGAAPAEQAPSPELVLTAMPTDPIFRTDLPVFGDSWAVAPTAARRAGVICWTRKSGESSAHFLSLDGPPTQIPIAPDTCGLSADTIGEQIVVLAQRPDGADCRTERWTSLDGLTWLMREEVSGLEQYVQMLRGGMVITNRFGGFWPVHDLAEDGTLSALTPLALPDEREWAVNDALRAGDRAIVILTCRGEGSTSHVVRSEDGGRTWSAPEPLPHRGSSAQAHRCAAVGGTIVVMGTYESEDDISLPAGWAWAEDGALVEERVPMLPWEGRNAARTDPGVVMTSMNARLSSVLPDAGGQTLVASYTAGAFACRAVRDGSGVWLTETSPLQLEFIPDEMLWDGDRMLLRHQKGIERCLSTPASGEGAGGVVLVELSPPFEGDFLRTEGSAYSVLGRLGRRSSTVMWEADGRYTTKWTFDGGQCLIDAEGLRPLPDPPEGAGLGTDFACFAAADGREFVIGYPDEGPDEDPPFMGWSRVPGGAWSALTGLPQADVETLAGLHRTESGYLIAFGARGSDDEPESTQVWASHDGISWEPHSDVISDAETNALATIDGALLAAGAESGDGARRPVLRRFDGEQWTTQFLSEEEGWASSLTDLGGRLLISGSAGGFDTEWRVDLADALPPPETSRPNDLETAARYSSVSLGGGMLLAVGQVYFPGIARGMVLWRSIDGGQTWDWQLLPGAAFQYWDPQLLTDGQDIYVLQSVADGPLVHRIEDAVGQLRRS